MADSPTPGPPAAAKRPRRRRVFMLALAALIAAGIFSLALYWVSLGATPQDQAALPFPHFPSLGPSVPHIPGPALLPQWKGSERVNILLLGLDQRPNQLGQPTRSDTIIVATLEPLTRTGGLLSVPRDLWVAIPGYGEGRVNSAHLLGERDKYPGGGPALAKKTLELNLGIPIHYYIRINLRGFEEAVDAIGGILLDVPRPVKDNEYPAETEEAGVVRIYIPQGIQRMDGRTALQYARSRHGESDFGRMQRQQQVLLALRQQAGQLNLWPRLPAVLGTLKEAIQTDVPWNEMLALVALAQGLENISARSIDHTMVTERWDLALLPKRREVARLVREVFFDARLRQDAARLEVLNGTTRPGLAAAVAAALKERDFTVVRADNAGRSDYSKTVILDLRGKKYTAQLLANLLGLPLESVRSQPSDAAEPDIRVILGPDAKMP